MTRSNKLVAPFLKWVGGKRQLISSITQYLPENIHKFRYIEPFIGGGAVFFHLQPQNAKINDLNKELMNVYLVIKNNLQELITDLRKHQNNVEYFYKIRGLDRSHEFKNLTDVERASRVIYLNKTCFNGLYRVNNAGEFNAPFGYYKNPNIINEPTLKAVHQYLNTNNIMIQCSDYTSILQETNDRTFVYLDPPYHPISENSNFTGYVQGGWNDIDQIKLKEFCDQLNERGVKFLLSNSSSSFIKNLYKDYQIIVVQAHRAINSDGNNRGEIDEVLIRNYEKI